MSYCNKIDCSDLENMKPYQFENRLDYCVEHCDKYFTCDTVAYMDDKLKKVLGWNLRNYINLVYLGGLLIFKMNVKDFGESYITN